MIQFQFSAVKTAQLLKDPKAIITKIHPYRIILRAWSLLRNVKRTQHSHVVVSVLQLLVRNMTNFTLSSSRLAPLV